MISRGYDLVFDSIHNVYRYCIVSIIYWYVSSYYFIPVPIWKFEFDVQPFHPVAKHSYRTACEVTSARQTSAFSGMGGGMNANQFLEEWQSMLYLMHNTITIHFQHIDIVVPKSINTRVVENETRERSNEINILRRSCYFHLKFEFRNIYKYNPTTCQLHNNFIRLNINFVGTWIIDINW